jgi:hypothetical protein
MGEDPMKNEARRAARFIFAAGAAMPAFIQQFENDRLYAAEGSGQFYLVLPASWTAKSIELAEAWSSKTLRANFVYSTAELGITKETSSAFVDAVLNRVMTAGPDRGFLWMLDPGAWRMARTIPLDGSTAPMIGMNEAATRVQTGMTAPILPGAALTVANGSTLELDGTLVTIGGAISFSGARAPAALSPSSSGVLQLDGDARGTIGFTIYLWRQSLNDSASWGFQFLFPAPPGSTQPAVYEWLPLADPSPPDAIGFGVTMDPSDPANRVKAPQGLRPIRSLLAFTGLSNDGNPTTLLSHYRTTSGIPVTLTPIVDAPESAALVFNGGVKTSDTDQELQLAPMGEFTLSTTGSSPSHLLCGLHGTESLSFQSGSDRIRFIPYCGAYAPHYPFPEVSSVGPPIDLAAPLLDETYPTSWATVVRAPGSPGLIPYVAQPKGASLYGRDTLLWPETQLMGWLDPADTLPADAAFPLAPYSGVTGNPNGATFTAAQTNDFERQVIGPTRRARIGSDSPKRSSRNAALGLAGTTDGAFNTTTPTGLIATIDGGKWTRVLLGQNLAPPRKLYFCNPSPPLQQAFQTGQLFLVIANNENLGDFAGEGTGACDTTPQFFNTMEIGGWKLAANVGTKNRYDDYRNVIIVKGRKGKLYDPDDISKSLVANPEKWTQKETFAAPSDLVVNPNPPPAELPEPPNPQELVILSQWLQNYFEAAATTGGDDLAKFNQIARTEGWTGILILRMDISDVPADLAGITVGISDRSRFNAHHFGIEISQVTNEPASEGDPSEPPGPRIVGASSMFGLIDYVDPQFIPPPAGVAPQPVPPVPGTEYDFRVLQLKVLFANTAVRSFGSYAQLTTTSWFGMPVQHMGAGGNPYAALVLRGSLQNNSGQPVYSLSSAADTTFYFVNDVVNKIEITSATMSTRNPGTAPGAPVVSWFSLAGFIDFKTVQGGDEILFNFDVFSFGSEANKPDQLRRGLAFSNLGIVMSFPTDDPSQRDFVFSPSEIHFDLSTSTPRTGSLFQQLALDLQGFVQGTADSPPSKSGYTNVITDARLTGVDGGAWWGINYQLNMGTPGNLAGKVGLVSYLVTAWAPDSEGSAGSYKALVGLQLPGSGGGAKLISLQTVLKLSIGQILLKYDRENKAFLLLFTEIALKLFGLLSIPPGSTLFYLFGNPDGGGRSSGLGWYAMYRQKKPE